MRRAAATTCGALTVLLLVIGGAFATAATKDRPRWDTRVLALVGKPGTVEIMKGPTRTRRVALGRR